MQLLEPELPLRIRLIGLRVMNLRDLDIELKGGLDSVSASPSTSPSGAATTDTVCVLWVLPQFVTRSPPKAKAKKALVKAPKRAMSEGGSDASNAIALDLSADEGVSTDDEDGMKKFGDAAVLGEELATDGELGLLSDEGGSAEDEPVAKESQTCPVCSVSTPGHASPSLALLTDERSPSSCAAAQVQAYLDERRGQHPRRHLPLTPGHLRSRVNRPLFPSHQAEIKVKAGRGRRLGFG